MNTKYIKDQAIKAGTATSDGKTRTNGIIKAVRTETDGSEPNYLVKFKGDSTLYQVAESKITL